MLIVANGCGILHLLRSRFNTTRGMEEFLEHRISQVGTVPVRRRLGSLGRNELDDDFLDRQIFEFYRRDLLSLPFDEGSREVSLFIRNNDIYVRVHEGSRNGSNSLYFWNGRTR